MPTDLHKLETKRERRLRQRRVAKEHYKKTGKRGYALAAAKHGRAARKLRALIAQWHKVHPYDLEAVEVKSFAPGYTHWHGSYDVSAQAIEPFMVRRGLPLGSEKRTPSHNAAIGGSPTSDHLTTHTTTWARDYPTFQGEDDARALAEHLGIRGWQPNSYTAYNVVADGHVWRIQILWGGAIGHGDHVHVGVSYVGVA